VSAAAQGCSGQGWTLAVRGRTTGTRDRSGGLLKERRTGFSAGRGLGLAAALCLVVLVSACSLAVPQPTVQAPLPPAPVAEAVEVIAEGGVPLEPEAVTEAVPEKIELTEQEKQVLETAKIGIDFDLDLVDTQDVQQFFGFFTHRARNTFANWLKRAEQYLPFVRQTISEAGLPQDIAMLPFAESGYNVFAVSRAGAVGMWQFIPGTGRKYGLTVDWWLDERRDPVLSTRAALRYLSDLYEMFGDWYLALAAYNAGEAKIGRALERTQASDFFDLASHNKQLRGKTRLKLETRHYVPKFIAISKIFQNLEALGFEPFNWGNTAELETLEVPPGTDLLALAKAGNLSWSEFHELNPAFRRQVSPPYKTCTAVAPKAAKAPMLAYLADPASQPVAGYKSYVVCKGDSWQRIAAKCGVPQEALKQINASAGLKPGATLLVPNKSSPREDIYSASKTRKLAKARANYKVKKGDTIYNIAGRYKVSVKTLLAANGMRSAKSLKTGMRLYIPDATGKQSRKSLREAEEVEKQLVRYKVRDGDTLWSISKKFGVSTRELKEWNALTRKGDIRPGLRLKVYAR
jgi:membrane-bound lytic murein transglycosylase D